MLLSEIEGLKQEADTLHLELQEVGRTAEVAAKRSRRLAERSQQLQVCVEHQHKTPSAFALKKKLYNSLETGLFLIVQ